MEELKLKEIISMGLGGTIGGGIFAALGLSVDIAGNYAALSFLLAGVIALISGYSFVRIEEYLKKDGGTFTFINDLVHNEFSAVYNGWILLVGYVGTMALYSYAFGAFAKILLDPFISLPRSVLSVGVMLGFLALNLKGVKESGVTEDILVAFQIIVLVAFGIMGVVIIVSSPDISFFQTIPQSTSIGAAFIAIPVIFVSFEGFELLSYEYSEIEKREVNFKKGVYTTIITATLIYILIVIVVASVVTPEEILKYDDTILAYAATRLLPSPAVGSVAFVIVGITALFSTASAINATLFGTARLASTIAEEGDLPQIFARKNKENIPYISLITITLVTIVFTFFGSLLQITTFASVAFLTIFAVANYVAYKTPEVRVNPILPLVGLVAILISIPVFAIYIWYSDPTTIYYIVLNAVGLLVLVLVFLKYQPQKNDIQVPAD